MVRGCRLGHLSLISLMDYLLTFGRCVTGARCQSLLTGTLLQVDSLDFFFLIVIFIVFGKSTKSIRSSSVLVGQMWTQTVEVSFPDQ